MKIFIVGGTGLLGAAAAVELIKRGHEVCSIALPPIPEGADIPKEMMVTLGSYLEMSDEKLIEQMQGCEGFVFAAGVDERVEFAPPVYEAYQKYNIEPVRRLLTLAKSCGVKKAVILGSYFSYFAKVWEKLKLTEHHPYIRSRIEQEKVALSFSDDTFEVMVLELPYIFGAQAGRKPVWMILVDLLLPMKTIFYPKGGTTMVTVRQVLECIAGAIEQGKGGTCYPVGWYNLKWTEFLDIVTKAMGFPNKKIFTVPTFLYKLFSKKIVKEYREKNIEPGLHPVEFAKLMTANTFINKDLIESQLGVTGDDIEGAITESIRYCMEIKKQQKKVVEMKAE